MAFNKFRKYASTARAYTVLTMLTLGLSACGFIWGELFKYMAWATNDVNSQIVG